MGFRNPFRITLDENDVAYITDYSPDSQTPTDFRGPAGTGRMMIVDEPANYGWPLCYSARPAVLPLELQHQHAARHAAAARTSATTRRTGPANTSRWNTGLTVLAADHAARDVVLVHARTTAPTTRSGRRASPTTTAPARPPAHELFPELAHRRRRPHGAAKYDYDPAISNPRRSSRRTTTARSSSASSPATTCARSASTQEGNVFKINNLLNCGAVPPTPSPARPFVCDNPMDMTLGLPGRALLPAHLRRRVLQHQPGCGDDQVQRTSRAPRAPVVVLDADPTDGPAPLTVQFSSEGTHDPDPADSITFAWDFDGNGTIDSIDPNPSFDVHGDRASTRPA